MPPVPPIELIGTFSVLAIVAPYIALRRKGNGAHWLVLTLLAAMLAWTGGLSVHTFAESPAISRLGIVVAFLGVFTVSPCWLLLAARHTQVRLFDRSPGWLIVVLVPPAMTMLGVVTNPGHRLFLRDFSADAFTGNASDWAGPIFWLGLGVAILQVLVGSALYLGAAWRMISNGQRMRGTALAAIVTLPIILSPIIGIYTGREVTPAMLGLMAAALFAINWRHRVLDSLPIARRDVIEHLHDGVVLTDAEGRVQDANPVAEQMLGLSVSELRRRSLDIVLADGTAEGRRAEIEGVFDQLAVAGGSAVLEIESQAGRALELTVGGVLGGDGGLTGYYAVLRDQTEHRRYENIRRQSHRLETVASLSAGIAHEVNDPLAFVRSNLNHIHRISSLMSDELAGESGKDGDTSQKRAELDELKQVAEESVDGIERVMATLERMRRFSSLQEGELGPVDVNAVVRDALRMSKLRPGPDPLVRPDLASTLPPVHGSSEHLIQAFLNLIVNARQALTGLDHGVLRISTTAIREGVEVRVGDNGPGISEEIQERIFDPFYTGSEEDGTQGLGLSIAVGIVREHDGAIDLVSADGKGTEFVIRLPVRRAASGRS
jgi:PAS domain S-box-containing protein